MSHEKDAWLIWVKFYLPFAFPDIWHIDTVDDKVFLVGKGSHHSPSLGLSSLDKTSPDIDKVNR